MEQRHITIVMFSAVVHRSSTVTETAILNEFKSRMTTRTAQNEGDSQGPCWGIVWGRPRRVRQRTTTHDHKVKNRGCIKGERTPSSAAMLLIVITRKRHQKQKRKLIIAIGVIVSRRCR
jgi:hypothetical protein